MTRRLRFRLYVDMRGYKAGSDVMLEVDASGRPTNPFFARRFDDSKTDGCIKLVDAVKKAKQED